MVLYTTGCPMCVGLKTALDKAGCEYTVCQDVDVMLDKGISAVPMLEVDGAVLSFREAMQWIKNGGDGNGN